MNIKIKQHGITDCGAACLASVAAFYKLQIPLARIRQYASTDHEGTNILGMVEGAERLGFTAKGVKGPPESLKKVPKPVIAHVVIKGSLHHYMVIYKTGKKHLKVMDPADGCMHHFNYKDFCEIWTGILILLIPGNEFEPRNQEVSVGRRFLALIYPHKKVMLQALLGALIYTVLGLSISIYIQKITDYVLTDGNRSLLNMMSVAIIVILLFQLFIGVMRTVFTIRTGQQIDARMILGYYKHLLQLPRRFFDTMRIGEIVSRIDDAVKIRAFINDAAINLAVNVFIVVFSFALMFTYYWKLALIMMVIIPLYVIIYFITDRLNKRVQRRIMEEGAELESQLVESLNAISTIKLFGIESYANIKTETRFIALLRTVYKSSLNGVFSNTSTVFLSNVFTVLLLWIGAGYVLENRITPGELLSFYALTAYFTGPAGSLIGINKMARDAWVAADRLFEIMDLERERSEESFHLTKAMLGDISFENVHFRYGSRAMVFEGLTMRIPSGKVTAITGESGSGKTTLISLLQHVYPIQQGIIRIGNYDLKYISRDSLRTLLGVVPQQIDLFAGNVIENIAPGDFDPDMQSILDLCAQLGMIGFIEGLSDGFRTYLGENGALLSGGQKQRIAIARALYKQPEILILDEATSSLDPESEQYVRDVVRLLKQRGKTVIIIAHRMSAVRYADKIIVLKKGKVVEEGSHHELIAAKKNYYHLWRQQVMEL